MNNAKPKNWLPICIECTIQVAQLNNIMLDQETNSNIEEELQTITRVRIN
jgi:hypothetical protein